MIVYIQVRLFDGKTTVNPKSSSSSSSSVWYDDGSVADAAAIATATVTIAAAPQDQSPVRPPRRRCKPPAACDVGPTTGPAKRSHSLTASTTPVLAEIKSILKKPASLTTDDLSPVRVRSPDAATTASSAGVPCGGSQKKTKKQVQFDIVSVPVTEKARPEIADEVHPPQNNRSSVAGNTPFTSAPTPTVSPQHQSYRGRQSPTCKSSEFFRR